METKTITPTLEQIVQPLVDLLNEKKHWAIDVYKYAEFVRGPIDDINASSDKLLIELPGDITIDDLAMRAVATLLEVNGAATSSNPQLDPGDDGSEAPLRIGLVKLVVWKPTGWNVDRYLAIEHSCDELDSDIAARQVAGLVALISHPSNLAQLGDERELF